METPEYAAVTVPMDGKAKCVQDFHKWELDGARCSDGLVLRRFVCQRCGEKRDAEPERFAASALQLDRWKEVAFTMTQKEWDAVEYDGDRGK